jgi:DNA-binding beta-propeller fold protein YncE
LIVLLAALIVNALSSLPLHGQSENPLTLAQLRQLISIGAPDAAIAHEIQSRGLQFTPTAETVDDLLRRGAGKATVAAIRERMPTGKVERLPPPPASSEADVLYIPSHQGLGVIELDLAKGAERRIAKTPLLNNTLLAWNPQQKELYVAASNGDVVSVVQGEPFANVATIKGDVGWNTSSMVLSGNGRNLYLGCSQGGSPSFARVVVLSAAARFKIATVSLANSSFEVYLALAPDGSKLYVSWGNHIDVYDPSTMKLVRQQTYEGWQSSPEVLSSDGSFLFLLQGGRLFRLRTDTLAVDANFPLAEQLFARSRLRLTRDGSALFVSGQQGIYRVSVSLDRYTSIVPPRPSTTGPFSFAESSDGRALYVLSGFNQEENLWVIDIATQRVTQTVAGIPFPSNVLVVPKIAPGAIGDERTTTTDAPSVAASGTTVHAPVPTSVTLRFIGSWMNEDANTRGISRVEVRSDVNAVVAHMWGKCHPQDCDWGEARVDVSDAPTGTLNVKWVLSFAQRTQRITVLSDGRLKVDSHTHFTDNSGRADNDSTDYFIGTDGVHTASSVAICDEYNACLKSGAAPFQSKQWDQALAYYQKASSLEPNRPLAWNAMGTVYLASDRKNQAPAMWDKVLSLASPLGFAVCHKHGAACQRGYLTLRTEDVSFALSSGQKVFAVSPSDVASARVLEKSKFKPGELELRIGGKNYNFYFVPLGVDCGKEESAYCEEDEAVAQQFAVFNYVSQAIPKLASGAFKP